MKKAAQSVGMIVIDGMDGSGKGVQTRRLRDALIQSGYKAILTREPGGSPGAEEIRRLLVEGEPNKWDSMTELLLMYAARRSHLEQTIRPAIENGSWVVSDRFADSSRAFQGIAGELGLEIVETIHRVAVGDFKPDLSIILDVPVSTALERASARGGTEDRFERKGVEYHQKVRDAFIKIAKSDNKKYALIDASMTMDQVTEAILQVIESRLHLGVMWQPA
ncbi:MAG: dTMP kinase [Gammaproteobacteria bacterium]|nr:dTMP kinase [Gammaproteobacteria bacterium]